MEREVEDYIQTLSDLDLLEYTRCKTHLPEALEFARVELARRHLTSDRLADLEKQLQDRIDARAAKAEAIASEPLPFKWRLAVFLSGLYLGIPLLFYVPAWLRFRKQGAQRKYKDMWVYAVAGFACQPIPFLLRIPPWSWLARLF